MLGKTLVAAVFGLPVTMAILGPLTLIGPGDWQPRALPTLLWAFPLWTAILALTFVFRSARQAALWWSLIAAAGFVLLHFIKTLHWFSWSPAAG